MQKGFAAPFILIGLFILIVVAGGAYYLGKSGQTVAPPIPLTSTPNPTEVNISNTKIYSNEKIGFSIVVPNNEVIEESVSGSDWQWAKITRLNLIIANSPPSIGDPFYLSETERKTITVNGNLPITLVLSRRGSVPGVRDSSGDTDEIQVQKNAPFTSKYYVDAKVPHEGSLDTFNEVTNILSTFRFLTQGLITCNINSDCNQGESCLVEGPIIAGQQPKKVCVSPGTVVPL